jgi:DNA-binding NarL/FixJ family response regulator
MDAERKYVRAVVKKSLRTQFEKIVYDAKLTEQEEAIVRMRIEKNYSVIKTAMTLHICESSVNKVMREFYERAQVMLV